MNYRHAYHAGNHADVFKHGVLALVLEHLKKKPAPFAVLDAHAGIGLYALDSEEAEKTGEWRTGAGLLYAGDGTALPLNAIAEALLAPWRAALAAVNGQGPLKYYPGSPEIIRFSLRAGDRAIFNELHRQDHETLQQSFARDRQVRVTAQDAALSVKADLPFAERRGLVLLDPPYEKTDETGRTLQAVREAQRRFATGILMVWYPVTGDGLSQKLVDGAAGLGIAKTLNAEMLVRTPRPDGGLAGSGLIVINPPWQLDEQLGVLLPALSQRLAQGPGAGWRCAWLTGERTHSN